MAEIISNRELCDDKYLMTIKGNFKGEMGQFYMLRAWDLYPLLSRPLSIFDIKENSISFLYQVAGKGTSRFSELKRGDKIKLDGPYGHGFPGVEGQVALVGGGMGIAPLYLASRRLKDENQVKKIDIYLGFSEKALLVEEYRELADELVVDVGGFITDSIDVENYDYIFTCGPEPMMKKLNKMCRETVIELYVSIEKRMACGIGACLGCTCQTRKGNKKACKDGPVFRGSEIFYG